MPLVGLVGALNAAANIIDQGRERKYCTNDGDEGLVHTPCEVLEHVQTIVNH